MLGDFYYPDRLHRSHPREEEHGTAEGQQKVDLIHRIDEMGSSVTSDVLNSSLRAMIWGFLMLSTVHFVTESTQTTQSGDKCKGAQINCSATFPDVFAVFPGYAKLTYTIKSSDSVCSFDALGRMSDISRATRFMIALHCERPGIRIVITSVENYNISVTMLSVTNCSLHWEDISVICRNGNLKELALYDWKDEFTSEETTSFATCLQQQYSRTDRVVGGSKPVIAGMSNIGEIMVINTEIQTMSPAFTLYLWPAVRQLTCLR